MTSPSFILPAVKNNVKTPTLLGSIGAADVTIVVQSGEGALFPTIYRGDCSSTGSGILLNDTSGLGSVAVGDFIENLTDGSWAIVTSIAGAPNSVATTPLEGGSDNTWQSGDIWCVNAFIITVIKFDTDGETVLKRERMKVTNRVTDTFTVVRGYDGDTGLTFDADDSVQLLVEKSQVENLQKAIRNILQKVYTNTTDIAANKLLDQVNSQAWLGTITGTNTLTGSLTPAITAYSAGLQVSFIVANANTGAVTININSLGAKTVTRVDGATALVANDFKVGQLVELEYDGTNFQMKTPSGIAATSTNFAKNFLIGYTDSATRGASSTSDFVFDVHNYTIVANDLVAGIMYEFEWSILPTWGAGNIAMRVKLGGSTLIELGDIAIGSNLGGLITVVGYLVGTAAAGGSVAVRAAGRVHFSDGATMDGFNLYGTLNAATNGTLLLECGGTFRTSNGSNSMICKISKITKNATVAF